MSMDPTRQRIAALMADGKERTAGDVANALGIHVRSASQHLRWMSLKNVLTSERIGERGNLITAWKYERTEAAE